MNNEARLPLPPAGKPLKTVLQINNAIRRGEPVYAELSNGRVRKTCLARRRYGIFQVRLEEGNQWESTPRHVWSEKDAKAAQAPPQTRVPRPAHAGCKPLP